MDRCINSILAQTITDFVLVLVDDGSFDGSGEMCEYYKANDSRIVVFHQQNLGQSKARNVGLDYAFLNDRINYITFIDGDDVVSPVYLEVLLNTLVAEKSDLCMAELCVLHENDVFIDRIDNCIVESSTDLESFWMKHNAPVAVCKLYKKSCFFGVRYPEGVIYEDEATTYKTVFNCKKVTYCNSIIYGYYRYRPNSTMNKETTPQSQQMWLNSFRQQMDFYYLNNYDKLFSKYFRIYTNHIQQAVIDSFGNCEYDDFFKKIAFSYRRLPMEYPEYFLKKSLKGEYIRIFKLEKRIRKDIIYQDYLHIKTQNGNIFATLFWIKQKFRSFFTCYFFI